MYEPTHGNPTDAIDVSWHDYVSARVASTQRHLVGGIPDYAFALDMSLRQKLHAMPGFDRIAKTMMSTIIPQQKQRLAMNGLKVGPTQMPEVYAMVVDCARRLGIGTPEVYIEHDIQMNAYSVAMSDDAPLIAITTGMLERATPGELKAVIGHECGHSHNNHSLYNNMAVFLIEMAAGAIPGMGALMNLVSAPFQLALMAWSRAAEVTADRAGVICSDDINDSITLQAKLLSGGAIGVGNDFDVDSIVRQYDAFQGTSARYYELNSTHPVGARRILAVREFMHSETLYTWRPEWRSPNMKLIDKAELDARCDKVVSVLKSEKRGGAR